MSKGGDIFPPFSKGRWGGILKGLFKTSKSVTEFCHWSLNDLTGERIMSRRELRKIDTQIKTIKKATQELKQLSGGIQAVDRNAERILASVKMLEINISDLVDLKK